MVADLDSWGLHPVVGDHGPVTTAPFSPGTLAQLESDARDGLKGLSAAIIKNLKHY